MSEQTKFNYIIRKASHRENGRTSILLFSGNGETMIMVQANSKTSTHKMLTMTKFPLDDEND